MTLRNSKLTIKLTLKKNYYYCYCYVLKKNYNTIESNLATNITFSYYY